MNNKFLVTGLAVVGFGALGLSTQASADTVTVKAGDTVSSIANQYHSSVNDIANDNKLSNVDLILVGEQLQVNSSNAQQADQQEAHQSQYKASVSVSSNNTNNYTSSSKSVPTSQLISSEQSAKNQVAQIESGGNYSAQNGKYIGKYQLDSSYLNGDYSVANQEKVANQYVTSRYGSWQEALNHEKAFGWY